MKLTQKLLIAYLRMKLKLLSFVSPRKAAECAYELFCTPRSRVSGSLPSYFGEAENLQFVLQGHTVHGYRWNHPAARKALVVHGFQSSVRNFDKYISSLVKKGYEVLAFDAPAHGKSTGTTLDLPLYLSMIRKICDSYGPVHAYVAHSYGGLVVSHFLETVQHDESVKAVFIAPATETTSSIDIFFSFLRLSNKVKTEFHNLIYRKSGFWPSHYSIRRAMNQINALVLWFHDEDDELTPVADALNVENDRHPNIHFRISKGLGHRKIYRDSKIIGEVMTFL